MPRELKTKECIVTETSDPEQKNAQHAANVAGCVGAMLAHPVAMALAFAHGFIYGATPMVHGPAPASGLNGGAMAAKQLLVFYFFRLAFFRWQFLVLDFGSATG